jgi:hypothetical protein
MWEVKKWAVREGGREGEGESWLQEQKNIGTDASQTTD